MLSRRELKELKRAEVRKRYGIPEPPKPAIEMENEDFEGGGLDANKLKALNA